MKSGFCGGGNEIPILSWFDSPYRFRLLRRWPFSSVQFIHLLSHLNTTHTHTYTYTKALLLSFSFSSRSLRRRPKLYLMNSHFVKTINNTNYNSNIDISNIKILINICWIFWNDILKIISLKGTLMLQINDLNK